MTRANPSCPNFGMTNELRGVEKKTERVFQLSPFQYPDPHLKILKWGKCGQKAKQRKTQ